MLGENEKSEGKYLTTIHFITFLIAVVLVTQTKHIFWTTHANLMES